MAAGPKRQTRNDAGDSSGNDCFVTRNVEPRWQLRRPAPGSQRASASSSAPVWARLHGQAPKELTTRIAPSRSVWWSAPGR